jgi:undecaprenyl-diphosphatase
LTVIDAVLLGSIQGLTEFLPVSSSAHLIFAQHYLPGFDRSQAAVFDVTLHLGTLLSLLVYYRKELLKLTAGFFASAGSPREAAAPDALDRRYALLIVLATVVTVLVAFPLRHIAESEFNDPRLIRIVGLELAGTGVLLLLAERFSRGRSGRARIGWLDAAWIGLAQAIGAVSAGISRSGITIAAALSSGLDRDAAVRFSFLISIPAILGAAVVEGASHLGGLSRADAVPYAAGTLAAFLVGLLAIKIVVETVRRGRLFYFAIYCWILGGAVFFFA